jgi:uncharacterized protein YceH (UPF0502 family)
MSAVPEASTPEATASLWPVLSVNERRVLGVLVEKAKTTPDVYPLSMNSLITGSNQKSNRDPVLDLSDLDVEEALVSCQKKGLAIKITGGRVERWRHNLYDVWHADKVELAILAELLLRGPQTEGELRGRASRMEPIVDLDALRALLKPLVERRLVVYLSPEGRRGTMVTHGFHVPEELNALRSRHRGEDTEPSPIPPSSDSRSAQSVSALTQRSPDVLQAFETRLTAAQSEISRLHKTLAELQAALANLTGAMQKPSQPAADNPN